jgi:hypothetical protein
VIVLDGEAVLLGVDGRSDFNGLHTRWHDHEVEFYAFDILVSDGEDIRKVLEPAPLNRTCGRHAKIGVSADMRRAAASGGFQNPWVDDQSVKLPLRLSGTLPDYTK